MGYQSWIGDSFPTPVARVRLCHLHGYMLITFVLGVDCLAEWTDAVLAHDYRTVISKAVLHVSVIT